MIPILVIALSVGATWLYYWVVVRPVLMGSLRRQMRDLVSEMSWARIDGRDEAETATGLGLSKRLEELPYLCDLSVMSLAFQGRPPVRESAEIRRYREEIEGAPSWMRNLDERRLDLAIRALLYNSPFWWPMIATVLLFALLSAKVKNRWEEWVIASSWSPPTTGRRFA